LNKVQQLSPIYLAS